MTEQLVRQALHDFNRGEVFFDHLSDDVVLEFPYGPTLGGPEVIVGKDGVRAHLAAVRSGGLRVGDPTVVPAGERGFLAEYTGTYLGPDGATARIPLVALIEHDGTAISRIREYWDTLRLARLREA